MPGWLATRIVIPVPTWLKPTTQMCPLIEADLLTSECIDTNAYKCTYHPNAVNGSTVYRPELIMDILCSSRLCWSRCRCIDERNNNDVRKQNRARRRVWSHCWSVRHSLFAFQSTRLHKTVQIELVTVAVYWYVIVLELNPSYVI